MYERVDQTQKEKRIIKSRIYKEMLDNQILMNKHYKQSQLTKAKSNIQSQRQQHRNKNEAFMNKKIVMLKKMKQRNLEENCIVLPSIAAEPRYYRGHSRYRSIDESQAKNFITNIVRTQIDQHPSSESEVEEIIKQMQQINQKIKQNNHRRSKRLQTNQNPKERFNSKRQQMFSTLDLHEDYNPEHNYGSSKSKSLRQSYDKKDNTLTQKVQQLKNVRNKDKLSLQNDTRNSFICNQKQLRSIQKSQQMKKQRQKFMNILKKVNKRGKNLLLRVSNFPSPKTQFIDPNDV